MTLSEDQIKHMAERFLGWRIPQPFRPDAGVSFEPEFNVEYNAKLGKPPARHEPTGTNLWGYTEAVAMVRHMVEDLPDPSQRPVDDATGGEWVLVPREPTEEMVRAAQTQEAFNLRDGLGESGNAHTLYRAMLSAAPKRPEGEGAGFTDAEVEKKTYRDFLPREEIEPEETARRDLAEIMERHGPALKAALSGSKGDGWQPIETAPRDGTLILVFAPGTSRLGDLICPCAWHPDAGFCVCELREPTHWMRLPDPPSLNPEDAK